MRVLLTGATGYIGQNLLQELLERGDDVVCCVREPERFQVPKGMADRVTVVKVDFLQPPERLDLKGEIDVAYYLIHSMSASTRDFGRMEAQAAENFLRLIEGRGILQVIYLSGIINEDSLSQHLHSRLRVEEILRSGPTPVTTLRAGIIVGAGSASFELIRDLVEKLPVMIAPKWLRTRCQPIAIQNVLEFLTGVALRPPYYNQSFDIGGPNVMSYKEMLKNYARVRRFRRPILTVPVMTPRLSSYWLYFVTSVSYPLAVNLVNSMKVEVICRPNKLAEELGIELIPYRKAVRLALRLYRQDAVYSSWKDALSSSYTGSTLGKYQKMPRYGILKDARSMPMNGRRDEVLENIWAIGGRRGWYYGNWLWKIRGVMDKFVGGVGLRRGRTNARVLEPGDALDFWRVVDADKQAGRLLLFAEMKLPGEAWLEFRMEGDTLFQTAVFRPRGIWGRLYWHIISPLHYFVFRGMLRRIVRFEAEVPNRPHSVPA